jgi:hypothetical protein
MRLLVNRPASTSNTSDSEICSATSALRKRKSPRPPADCADCAFMTAAVSVRPAESAGINPNSTTVPSVMAAAKSTTGGFKTIPRPPGRVWPAIAWITRSVAIAAGKASSPPTSASAVASASCATAGRGWRRSAARPFRRREAASEQ